MSKKGRQAIAVIDLSVTTLTIYDVPDKWGSEEIEWFLQEEGYRINEISWGAFDGEINDKR